MLRHLYKPVICKIQGSVLAGALLMVTNSTHAIAIKEAKVFGTRDPKRTLASYGDGWTLQSNAEESWLGFL